MRLRATVLALAVTALVLAVAPASGAGRETTVTVFHAFTATGRPTIRVQQATGSCFTSSLTTDRADAWRCDVGNYLYDPCFSSPRAPGAVICPKANPASGVEIRLSAPLPTAYANHGSPSATSHPWTLELFSGAHCALASGASSVVHGVRLNYFCPGNTKSGLWGSPRRTSQPWTILIAPFAATTLSKRVALEHVWT